MKSINNLIISITNRLLIGILAIFLGCTLGNNSFLTTSKVHAANYDLKLDDTYVQGNIPNIETADFYKIVLPSSGWLTVTIQGFSITNGYADVLTADLANKYGSCNVTGSSQTNPKSNSVTIPLEKGTYIVKAYGGSSDTGIYRIKAALKPAENNEAEPNNDFSTAMKLDNSQLVRGFCSVDDRMDIYKVTLDKAMTVRVLFTTNFHSYFQVFDSNFERMGGNDTFWGHTETPSEDNPLLLTKDFQLPAGNNYIKVVAGYLDGSDPTLLGRYYIKWIEAPTLVTEVKIKGSTSGRVGETIQLTADITPDNATNKTLKWESSDSSVATVDNSGKVTLKKEGTVTITASTTDDSELSDKITITVKEALKKVTEITISGKKTLKVGSTIKLTATVKPSNATNKKVKWSTTNKNIATVSESGKVKAKKAGKVTIIATAADGSGVSGTYDLKITKKNQDPDTSNAVKKTTSVSAKVLGSKKVKVSWKKQKSAAKYEIQIATNKKFSKNLLVKNIAKSKNNAKITYKKSGNVYIRVRALDKYGYVGKWSDVKTVNLK